MTTTLQRGDWPEHFEDSPYCMSVLSYMDRNGNLTGAEASQLLREHSTSMIQLMEDGYQGQFGAVELLQALGY